MFACRYHATSMLTCFDGRTNPIPELTERDSAGFWSKVDKSGECWLWTAGTNKDDYGAFCVQGKDYNAHRISHQIANGPTSLRVRHECDNPRCENPGHLVAGRQKDNSVDMGRRGRVPGRVLNEQVVLEIIRLNETEGLGEKCIAKRLGLKLGTVRKVLDGRTWAWLTGRAYGATESPDITFELAAKVRRSRAEKKTDREISLETEVHPQTVGDICRGRSHDG